MALPVLTHAISNTGGFGECERPGYHGIRTRMGIGYNQPWKKGGMKMEMNKLHGNGN